MNSSKGRDNINMRNSCLGLFVSAVFLISVHSCTKMPTSYVKPSLQELEAVRKIAVTIEGSPEFTHIGTITSESSALIILFGPPAVILDTAIRSGIDDKSAKEIKPKELTSMAHPAFIDALVETLQQSKHFDDVRVIDNVDEQRKNGWDAVIDVKIVRWGSRIKQSGSEVVIPFMDIQIGMIRQRDNMLIWNEIQTVTHDTHHTLNDYKQQEGLFGSDFMALTSKAGRQVAALLLDF